MQADQEFPRDSHQDDFEWFSRSPETLIECLKDWIYGRGAWGLAGLYAGLVIAGQLLLFADMDSLRSEGWLALVFPLALGTCIVLVALCDILENVLIYLSFGNSGRRGG